MIELAVDRVDRLDHLLTGGDAAVILAKRPLHGAAVSIQHRLAQKAHGKENQQQSAKSQENLGPQPKHEAHLSERDSCHRSDPLFDLIERLTPLIDQWLHIEIEVLPEL